MTKVFNSNLVTLFFTGGHATPAQAVIEEIRLRHPDWKMYYLGRINALEGESVEAEEASSVRNLGIQFLPINSIRLSYTLSFQQLIALIKFPIGLFQALLYLLDKRPQVIVSFGSYVALPVVIVGWILHIPIVAHEQTHALGLANRITTRLASCVCISFNDTKVKTKGLKIYTGLPLRRFLFDKPQRTTLDIDTSVPLLYIAGGSTGSVSLNEFFYPLISQLIKSYSVIHQVGRLSLNKALTLRQSLQSEFRRRYIVVPYLTGSDYAWTLHQAKVIIGRSGANTVGEVSALGKVAIWIPLPWSRFNEQMQNALASKQSGTGQILEQAKLNPVAFFRTLKSIIADFDEYHHRAQKLSETYRRDGAEKVAQQIDKLISHVKDTH